MAIGWLTSWNDTRDRPRTLRRRSSGTFIGPGDAAVVEAMPAGAAGPLAESLQVALAVVLEYVVLAGHVEHRHRQVGKDLLYRVEFSSLRQVRQIARVEHECRRFRVGFDLRDRGAQCRRDIGVRGLIEPDVTVADLDEVQ